MIMIYSLKNILLYSYETIKHEKRVEPEFVASIQLKDDLYFMQFPTSDLIALFYSGYF